MGMENGFLRVEWTIDEVKGQGGCDDEIVVKIVGFADRLDWDVDCELKGLDERGRQVYGQMEELVYDISNCLAAVAEFGRV
jgi:hypothetical protein